MKTTIFLLAMSLCISLMPLTGGAATTEAGKQGMISSFSIEDRTMLMNEKEFLLADKMQVVNKANIAAGEMILKKGQSIEYWLDTKSDSNMHFPKDKAHLPVIKRIRVLSDVKMNY
jgi:hypothetical protein